MMTNNLQPNNWFDSSDQILTGADPSELVAETLMSHRDSVKTKEKSARRL